MQAVGDRLSIEDEGAEELSENAEVDNIRVKGDRDLLSLIERHNQAQRLKELIIEDCRCNFPETFGIFSGLESLEISCSKLQHLPESFGSLCNLQRLEFYSCHIKYLPESFGSLFKLKSLQILECNLQHLPESFGNLSNLESLKIWCSKLQHLPESFGSLCNLQRLNLDSCHITYLPESFGSLFKLQHLKIHCVELNYLPESFGSLCNLEHLDIHSSTLNYLPESFGSLCNLQHLEIYCSKLNYLPESLGSLRNLKSLKLLECNLQHLPESLGNLCNLEKFTIGRGSFALESLCELNESFGQLQALKKLKVAASNLRSFPESFGSLQNLQHLKIHCGKLNYLPESFGSLCNLQHLEIYCDKLNYLPESFGSLCNLQQLKIHCRKLNYLPESLGSLCNLQGLEMYECSMEYLPELFGSLCNLQHLEIDYGNLKFPQDSFGSLCNLEKLIIVQNENFDELNESFGQLRALKMLKIVSCNFKCLPESFGSLQNLKKLCIRGKKEFCELNKFFGQLQALEELCLSGWNLQCLPDSFDRLFNLVRLLLPKNNLQVYPKCTLQLPKLRELDISNDDKHHHDSDGDGIFYNDPTRNRNCIAELPLELAETRLEFLLLDGNPITFPPEAIWEQGLGEIMTYMKEIRRGREQIRSDTINMLGESEAGKTSIALSLAEGMPKAAEPDDRTRVMQQLRLKVDADCSVSINDFGGHPIYHSVIPIFLPSNGLTILALNLQSEIPLEIQVKNWLLTAFLKSTEIRVIICGTRSDLISEGECLSLTQKINDLVENVCNCLITDVTEQIRELQFLKENPHAEERQRELEALEKKFQTAKRKVATVSCVENNGSLKALHSNVVDLLERRLDSMPARWCIVMNDILEYQGPDFPYLTMDHLKEKIYKKYIKDDPECKSLPIILRYLVASSQILWLEHDKNLCDFIFHSPQRIVEVCKKVLDHDQVLRHVEEWTGDRQGSESARKFNDFLAEYKRGILSEQLLVKILSSNQESKLNLIINFLQHFNLLSEIQNHESSPTKARKFVIPSNLPEEDPYHLQVVDRELRKCPVTVCVALSFLGDMIPRSFFETSLSSMLTAANALSNEPSNTGQWRNGVYICHDGVYCIVRRLDASVTATAGSSYEQNPWSVLLPVLKALLQNVSSSWPGEPSQCAVLCPACQYYEKTDVGEFKVFSKELLDHRTVAESRASSYRPCPECKCFVPRSLCYPVTNDSLLHEKEALQNFYNRIADEKELNFNAKNQVRHALLQVPAGSAAAGSCGFSERKRRSGNANSTSTALKQKKTAAAGIGGGSATAADDQLLEKLRLSHNEIATHLTEKEVDAIVSELYSCSTVCIIPEEKEHVLNTRGAIKRATKLLDILEKKSSEVILIFAQTLQKIGRLDLASRLCSADDD